VAPAPSQTPTELATATRANLGFLLAKAAQRWNELLAERFAGAGYPEVRPAYGSILLPLWEEDELRMGELARRARLAKQTMTTMVRLMERDGLVSLEPDPDDGRARRVKLTERAEDLREVAAVVLADLDALVGARLTAREVTTMNRCLQEVMSL
jgi:DNA-binding MarR family transcriptional regulator